VIGVIVIFVGAAIAAASGSGYQSLFDTSTPVALATTATSNFTPMDFPSSDPLQPVGSLLEARAGHTATLLPDGRVVVAGGYSASESQPYTALSSVEIYDPGTKQFQKAGSLLYARSDHVAALLGNGQILVAGGKGYDGQAIASAEIFDPNTGVSVTVGPMAQARIGATAVTLSDGRILIVGGDSNVAYPTAEIFDPQSLTFSSLVAPLGGGSVAAVKMTDGRVLVAGGSDQNGPSAAAAIFDPASNTFLNVKPLSIGREGASAGLLPDGTVMIVGGAGPSKQVNTTGEIFDPVTDAFGDPIALGDYRWQGTVTALPDDTVLMVGGVDEYDYPLGTVERDTPGNVPNPIGTMSTSRAGQTATLLADGNVLIVGGWPSATVTLSDADLYLTGVGPVATPKVTSSPGDSSSPSASGSAAASGSPSASSSPGASGSTGASASPTAAAISDPFSLPGLAESDRDTR
jgi:hypothetical protein